MNTATVTILVAVGAVIVFVLLREFWCWFFKINEIRNLLKRLVELNEPEKDITNHQDVINDPDQIVICRRCGSFKPKDDFCPDCRSGWAGKKLSEKIIAGLRDLAQQENLSFDAAVKKMAVCKSCGSLKNKDTKCPNCGSK